MMGFWDGKWHQLDHMQTICTTLQTDNLRFILVHLHQSRFMHLAIVKHLFADWLSAY